MRFENAALNPQAQATRPAAPVADLSAEQRNELLQQMVSELLRANQELRFRLASLEQVS